MDMQKGEWLILHIEDDEDDFCLAKSWLSQAKGRKITIDWAPTYDEGRAKLAISLNGHHQPYDAVLVDYDLGEKSGIEIIQEFSASYPAPLILYTGKGSWETDLEAMQAGATMYLAKSEAGELLLERTIRYAIERKQTEIALSVSQEALDRNLRELETIYKNAPVGLCVFDDQLRWIRVNETIAEINGIPIEEHIGKTPSEVVPDVGQQAEDALRQILSTGQRLDFEMTGATRAQPGVIRNWSEHWSPIIDDEGKIIGISVAAMEITRQKQAEEELRRSEEKFSKAFLSNVTPLAIFRYSDGVFLEVNDRILQLIGYTREEVIGHSYQELGIIDPAMREKLVQYQNEVGPIRDYEIEQKTKSGEIRQILASFEPLEIDGETYVLTGQIDITNRKKMERALQKSQEELRAHTRELEAILNATPAYMWITHDPEAKEMTGNRMVVELMRMQEGDNLSKSGPEPEKLRHFKAMRDGKEIPNEELPVQQVAASGKPLRNYEFDMVFNDGQVVNLFGDVYPLFDDKGKPAGAVSAFLNITDRKKAEKDMQIYAREMERSNQALRDFAFIASHDLKEPLRKIQAFGHLLDDQFDNHVAGEGREFLHRIVSAAERMNEMLEGLLSYSRVTTKGEPFQEVDLGKIAINVLSDLEIRINETHGKVELGELPVIQSDPFQMHQLLQNLISNALKYHQPGEPPVVVVSCQKVRENQVQISVKDNGIGFPMKEASRIFQPFIRLHSRSAYDGTGIGLSICQKIVERHGGSISVESEPGVGSTFKVNLPIRQ